MEFKQCDKCFNDLPFTTTKEVKCQFCGHVHKINQIKFKLSESKRNSSSDTTATVVAASVISGSGEDC